MPAPAPLAHQFGWLTPQPMNSAANRFGQGAGKSPAIAAPPQTGTDSSQGRAIVTPTPRRNVRRDGWQVPAARCFGFELRSSSSFLRLFAFDSLVQELWAGDDRLDQTAEAVAVGRQLRAHLVDGIVVGGKRLRPRA